MGNNKFPGFALPESNYSKLPHELIGLLPTFRSLAELKIILYVLRHTWGYQEFDTAKRITMDEFEHGRKRSDGSRIDVGTGMTKNSLKDGIDRAVMDGFLIQESDGRDEGRSSYVYLLNILPYTGSKVDPPPTDGSTGSEVDPLGIKDSPPEDQELTPREAESDPRSEKDTPKEIKETNIRKILSLWKQFFPDKPQPRLTTKSLQAKVKTRYEDPHFVEIWQEAMRRASESPTLQAESWFDLNFFLKNDQNYQKCYNRWMAWKDRSEYKNGKNRGDSEADRRRYAQAVEKYQ